MATIEELEVQVKELNTKITTLTTEKENFESQVTKLNKKNTEILSEKKKLQAAQTVLTELGIDVEDADGLRDSLSALLENGSDDKSKNGKKTNLAEALKRQSEAHKLESETLKNELLQEKIERKLVTELSTVKDLASPLQMQYLLKGKLSIDEAGKLMVSENGVDVAFNKHIETLRANPDYQNQFTSKAKPGMGSEGAGGAGGEGGKQWKDMNATERAVASKDNPEKLKAELTEAGLGAFMP
jgi:hypothetical protein